LTVTWPFHWIDIYLLDSQLKMKSRSRREEDEVDDDVDDIHDNAETGNARGSLSQSGAHRVPNDTHHGNSVQHHETGAKYPISPSSTGKEHPIVTLKHKALELAGVTYEEAHAVDDRNLAVEIG
jgi:hypothetical protein